MDEAQDIFVCLCEAATVGRTDIINKLLKDYDLSSDQRVPETGNTPLHIACENGHIDCVRALLRANFPTNSTNKNGKTPFQLGNDGIKVAFQAELLQQVVSGNKERMMNLLKGGATPDSDGIPENASLLNWAIDFDQDESIVQSLIDAQATINLISHNGLTPLHVACSKNNKSIIHLLIENGADPHIKDKDGRIAKDLLTVEDVQLFEFLDSIPVGGKVKELKEKSMSESSSAEEDVAGSLFSLQWLWKRIARLEQKQEEHEIVVRHLRVNIESLVAEKEIGNVVHQLEQRNVTLERKLKESQEKIKQLQGVALQNLPMDEVCELLGLPGKDLVENVKEALVKNAVDNQLQQFNKERQSYEDIISSFETVLPQELKPKVVEEIKRTQAKNKQKPQELLEDHMSEEEDYSPSIFGSILSIIFGPFLEEEEEESKILHV